MNKTKSFIKSFVAIVTGDDATAKAEKAKRQAESALKTHIAILTGDTETKNDALERANTNLAKALVNNGEAINDRDYYVKNLLNSKNDVTSAEADLKKHVEKIAFLESQLKALDAEEAA